MKLTKLYGIAIAALLISTVCSCNGSKKSKAFPICSLGKDAVRYGVFKDGKALITNTSTNTITEIELPNSENIDNVFFGWNHFGNDSRLELFYTKKDKVFFLNLKGEEELVMDSIPQKNEPLFASVKKLYLFNDNSISTFDENSDCIEKVKTGKIQNIFYAQMSIIPAIGMIFDNEVKIAFKPKNTYAIVSFKFNEKYDRIISAFSTEIFDEDITILYEKDGVAQTKQISSNDVKILGYLETDNPFGLGIKEKKNSDRTISDLTTYFANCGSFEEVALVTDRRHRSEYDLGSAFGAMESATISISGDSIAVYKYDLNDNGQKNIITKAQKTNLISYLGIEWPCLVNSPFLILGYQEAGEREKIKKIFSEF